MNKTSNTTYIGITGFTRRDEVKEMLEHFETIGLNGHHKLMVGVLASSSTSTNEHKGYPKLGELCNIFVKHDKIFNTIHFRSRNHGSFFQDLYKLLSRLSLGSYDGIQLNTPWPAVSSIREIRRQCFKGNHYFITLEIGPEAFKTINSVSHLMRKLEEYNDCIDYVLLDGSAGQGIEVDAQLMKKYILEIKKNNNFSFGVGVAGGLCAENLHILKDLVRCYPSISIDAETKLRNSAGLNLDACRSYLTVAAQELYLQ